MPPEFEQVIRSIRRTGGRNTTALMFALKRLKELGVPDEEIIRKGMGQFPVGGEAVYTDDWYAPRFTPSFHLHEGTDIFAVRGTPVRAPADGIVRFGEEPVGGKAAYVTEANRTYYYMAHLDAYAPKVRSGSRVARGDIVGFVGDSGNAVGGSAHLHFEVHPNGGGPINPKPILDSWLDRALADVPAILAAYQGGVSRALTATASLSRLEHVSEASDSVVTAAESSLLWVSTITPAGGALRLAEAELARAAHRIDWDEMARAELAGVEARREANALARSLLGPVTPPRIGLMLGVGNA